MKLQNIQTSPRKAQNSKQDEKHKKKHKILNYTENKDYYFFSFYTLQTTVETMAFRIHEVDQYLFKYLSSKWEK